MIREIRKSVKSKNDVITRSHAVANRTVSSLSARYDIKHGHHLAGGGASTIGLRQWWINLNMGFECIPVKEAPFWRLQLKFPMIIPCSGTNPVNAYLYPLFQVQTVPRAQAPCCQS